MEVNRWGVLFQALWVAPGQFLDVKLEDKVSSPGLLKFCEYRSEHRVSTVLITAATRLSRTG